MEQRPKIGVGVIIIKENKALLFTKKKCAWGRHLVFSGGHLEFNEELENCAKREVLEETGICVRALKFTSITNEIFKEENKH